MSAAAATRSGRSAKGAVSVRPAAFQAALDRALRHATSDERVSSLLAATRIRMRFEFPDSGLSLNVAASEQGGSLDWSFGEPPEWSPKLVLTMDSAIANRYLQGRESLAIALARGQARFDGDSRAALVYQPATRLLSGPYRRVVEDEFPELATE